VRTEVDVEVAGRLCSVSEGSERVEVRCGKKNAAIEVLLLVNSIEPIERG
jgi:hypothetical protein